MKKFTKVCLIISLLLIIIGGTLCALGAAAGGWRLARELGANNTLVWFAWEIPGTYGWRYWYDLDDLDDLDDLGDVKGANAVQLHSGSRHEASAGEAVHHSSSGGSEADALRTGLSDGSEIDALRASESDGNESEGSIARNYEDTGVRAADVQELQIEIGGAALYLCESEDDCFRIWTEGSGTYRSYEKNGTFYLEGNLDKRWIKNGINDGEKVYLYLPKGMVFHEADIDIGAGLVEINTLSADEISLTAGAGKISAEKLTCTGLDVETGAGEAVLSGVTAQKLDVENGLGNTYIKGSISREIDVECGMGNTQLELTGSENDFNYDIECAVGSIRIGGMKYGALAEDVYINNRAAGECSVECSMGTISITFSNP